MNSSLALQIGDIVQLQDLRKYSYNSLFATVEDFDSQSQRFVVNLHEREKRIKIRAKNAKPILYPSNIDEKLNELNMLENATRSVADFHAEGLRIVESLHLSGMSPNELAYSLCAFSRSLEPIYNIRDQYALLAKLKAAFNRNIDQRARVYLEIEMAHIYMRLRESSDVCDIVRKVQNHPFGKQPEIFLLEIQAKPGNFLKFKTVYEETIEPILESGNHCYDLKKFESRFHGCLVYQACIAKDISFALQMLSKMRLCYDSFFGKALVLLHMNQPLEALEIFTQLQETMCKQTGGMNSAVFDLLYQKASCYMELKDKSNAFKCMKQLKRMGYHKALMEKLEKDMKEHFHNVRFSEKCASPAITKSKCSNPVCMKVEEGSKQFKACGRCKVAIYCSRRCQKTHYKSGHKEVCVKLAKHF